MSITVQDFANELKRPVAELLSQFREAGVSVQDEASSITAEDKIALLSYLKNKTKVGAISSVGTEPRRITLKRKETSELKLGPSRGGTGKTVAVEVRKRRTYIKRDEADQPESQADVEAAAKEQAERETVARAAAEAEAKRHQEEAEKKMRDEEAARRAAAEEESRKKAEEESRRVPTVVDPARAAAEVARRRAEENLRRSAEHKPEPKKAPEEQRRHQDRAGDSEGEADKHDFSGHHRPVAAIGKVGDQEGERIGEGAPGQHVGERQAADPALHRELDKHVRCHHDERHGGHEGQITG